MVKGFDSNLPKDGHQIRSACASSNLVNVDIFCVFCLPAVELGIKVTPNYPSLPIPPTSSPPSASPTNLPNPQPLLPHAPPRAIKPYRPQYPPDRVEFLDEEIAVIPKDTPIEEVMEWAGYENPLIVRV